MTQATKSQIRLYCILARKSPLAVVFRRGPSKQVQLLLWHRDTDEFHQGQWFKGRVYERRCDLSPSGERLIYFAANQKKPFFSWTAVSRPPFLSAVALWPKGDGWGGGGLFVKENKIHLNHRAGETTLAPGFTLPQKIQVTPLGQRPGWGEDSPIMDMRLERDGWVKLDEGEAIKRGVTAKVSWELDPPMVWSKQHPQLGKKYQLQMHVKGIGEKNGPWYVIDYVIVSKDQSVVLTLSSTDWADWDCKGDLLFGKEGKLYRVSCETDQLADPKCARQLIDFTDTTFANIESPIEAKQWKSKLREQRV